MKRTICAFCAAAALFSSSFSGSALAEGKKLNMTYLFGSSPDSYIRQVDRTRGALNEVSPNFFESDSAGNLSLTNQLNSALVSQMHAKGIRVVPFLSNHWDRQYGKAALANRQKLALQIADAVRAYSLDGVNIDIENVSQDDRAAYAEFVKALRDAMPDKEISVAVAANPSGWTTGWQGSYDYKSLSLYADYLMLMAYDESYSGSEPGPVAGFPWVEKSIQYVLGQGVPADKIVLGVPFYGRFWRDGDPVGGNSMSFWNVPDAISRYGASQTYDPVQKSVKATFSVPDGSGSLPQGKYTLWYDDEASLKEKLKLIGKYGLKGAGSWSLNQEDNSIWSWFSTWVNGTFFTVYQYGNALGDFSTLSQAVEYANKWDHSKVVNVESNRIMSENYPVEFQSGVASFSKPTTFYASPSGSPMGTISPQELVYVEKKQIDEGWLHVQTWLGDAWISAKDASLRPFPAQSQKLTLAAETGAYSSPYQTAPAASFAPQTVNSLFIWNSWSLISTSLGPKWVKLDGAFLGEPAKQNAKVWLTEKTDLYEDPASQKRTGAWSLAPQTVSSFENWSGWHHIYTSIGPKWIRPSGAMIGEPEQKTEKVTVASFSWLYNYPSSESKSDWALAPQTVVSFEKWNGWYHVRTGAGAMWLSASRAFEGEPEQASGKISLASKTVLYEAPLADAASAYALSPQTVSFSAKWNGWYRVDTWRGFMWLKP